MDAVASALILEGAKLALQAYFINMRLAGKSESEINAIYVAEKAKFDQNKPELLKNI